MADKKYLILTYGCQMNVHESEKIAGILEKLNYSPCTDATAADIVVFNTCAIRESAEQKIFGNIGELKNIKLAKPNMIIAVGGCMSQQKNYPDEIMKRFPFVDIVFGTFNLTQFEDFLKQRQTSGKRVTSISDDEKLSLIKSEFSRTSGVNAWVNIMYGCNNFCTYCIVPYVRGREISRDPEDIIFEVKSLLDSGYKQITLLGQNVNSYSAKDKNGNAVNFAKLLQMVDSFDCKYRIRFMTSHPKDLSSEVIDVIAKSKHICHGLHLPVQSGSNEILKAMNRKYTAEKYLALVDEIKTKIPDAELSTDIIVGFPNETEEDFLQTLALVEKVKYTQIFAFIYSKRKGTVAEKMSGQIDLKVKKERLVRLNELKNSIINKHASDMLARTYEVLIESEENGKLFGTLDSGKTIILKGDKNLVGLFVDAKVCKVKDSVIFGEILNADKLKVDTSANFKFPCKVSILPKEEKSLKILRKNKSEFKNINDAKAKSHDIK